MVERRPRSVPPDVKPRGHRQYEATDAMRKVVEAMAGFGMPHTEIAKALTPQISVATLEKHYVAELETGEARVKTRVAIMCLVHLEGRPEERETVKPGKVGKLIKPAIAANSTMAIFMAKAKLGLRDVQVIEQTVDHTHTYDYSKLADDELRHLESLLTKAKATPADIDGTADNGRDSERVAATKH